MRSENLKLQCIVLLTLCSSCYAIRGHPNHRLHSRRSIGRSSQIIKPIYNNNSLKKEPKINLEISIDLNRTLINLNSNEIYIHRRNFTNLVTSLNASTGVHMVVIHQETLLPLFKDLFVTSQPAADKQLLRRLVNVHYGRLVILIGSAYYTPWLREEAKSFLSRIGSKFGTSVALGEIWALVLRNGHSKSSFYDLDVVNRYHGTPSTNAAKESLKKKIPEREFARYETNHGRETRTDNTERLINTDENHHANQQLPAFRVEGYRILSETTSVLRKYHVNSPSSPITIHLNLTPKQDENCSWHKNRFLGKEARFCHKYDGYKPFCRCSSRKPFLPAKRTTRENFEPIPVVIVTSSRTNFALRQIRQIRERPGGYDIPILLCVDGFNRETLDLSRLLNVKVVFHTDNKLLSFGSTNRIAKHVKWSLQNIISYNQMAKYVIVLEDDLELSPDFIRYFQQITVLMNKDSSILFANAYSYNAFPHTAMDSTRLHVVQSYPYYGWMARIKDLRTILENWNPHPKVDWDYYIHDHHLNNSYVLIPEVPRTKHVSGGGAHVTGYEQELYYDVRPINEQPMVNLKAVGVKQYKRDILKFLKNAQVLNFNGKECRHSALTKKKPGGKFVIYFKMYGSHDDDSAYCIIAQCFGFYDRDAREGLDGTFYRKYYFNQILLIGCPISPYCVIDRSKSALVFSPSVKESGGLTETFVRKVLSTSVVRRIPPSSQIEDVFRRNFVYQKFQI